MSPLSNIRTGVQYLGPLLALTYLALVTWPRPSCCGQTGRLALRIGFPKAVICDAARPLVANAEGIRDDAAQLNGTPENPNHADS
jgi:hypothetical protein